MEATPPNRGPGRVIILNGASSSGKSTLAKALQHSMDEPFMYVSSDQFVASGMLPERREDQGPFSWWNEMRPRFFNGFHRCLPALAAAGNDLIVEHVIEYRTWREDLSRLLTDFDVFLVGVHCDLAEIDRREHERGDRRIGEGREHVEINGMHAFGPYDYEVNTTNGVSTTLVQSVATAWRARGPRRVLDEYVSRPGRGQ
ncbi:chloramphenicol phosphotransferase CPT family protein [Nonomuraea sp. CA-143628]|uniref:chloramphenicol phosphotransferase CPT family protein n=1 Tax=Nonomuraea sp. CA-143628 TaxID=3239997 RepID=UPI003D89DECD